MEIEQTTQASVPATTRSRAIVPAAPADVDEMDSTSNRGLNLRSLGRTVQRQALLIAAIATAMTALAITQASKIRPNYQGDFQLLVEPVTNAARATDPLTVTRSGDDIPSGDVFRLDYPTQIQILTSPGMLNSIVQEVQTDYPNFSLPQLQRGLTVTRLVNEDGGAIDNSTRIIQVTYEDADPGLVQQVLKVTSDRFLRYSLEERKTRFGEGIKFIDDQLPEAQQRVNSIQDQIQQLQQRYDLVAPTEQGGQLSESINTINTLQQETDRQLREQVALYNSLRNQVRLNPSEAIAASALSEDPTYSALQTQLVEVDGQIATESARFNEASPVLQSLQERRKILSRCWISEPSR